MKKVDVDLEKELRAAADGMPVFRQCFEYKILMSFNNDLGAYAFNEWWYNKGHQKFSEWCDKHEEYKCETEEAKALTDYARIKLENIKLNKFVDKIAKEGVKILERPTTQEQAKALTEEE